MRDKGSWIGVYKNNSDKIIDKKDVTEKEVNEGYHAGGGITDEKEKAKLLRLDVVIQCGKAIK